MTAVSKTTATWSLRRRLAGAAGLAAALMLAGTATVVFVLARAQMIADFDRTWQARGEAVAATVEYHKHGWGLDEPAETISVFAQKSHQAAYAVWANHRQLIARSPALISEALPSAAPDQAQWNHLSDGRISRIQGWDFTPTTESDDPPAPPMTIVVMADASDLQRHIRDLGWLLGWATVIGAAITTVVMWVVVTHTMRPLHTLSTLLAAREPGEPAPLALPHAPRELLPVVDRLNQAFSRLETALTREKGFTADAAHELRTPLAALRLLLEVSLSETASPDARQHDVGEALALALRLQRIVEALLALARLDRGLVTLHPQLIDGAVVIDQAWNHVAAAAAAKGMCCERRGLMSLTWLTDADLLQQIALNLCDNAVSHGDARTTVTITLEQPDPATVTLTITNQARTAPADVSAAGQRWWRAESARSDAGRHIGIGLSLCQRMATLLHGDLALTRHDTRVSATLRFHLQPLASEMTPTHE